MSQKSVNVAVEGGGDGSKVEEAEGDDGGEDEKEKVGLRTVRSQPTMAAVPSLAARLSHTSLRDARSRSGSVEAPWAVTTRGSSVRSSHSRGVGRASAERHASGDTKAHRDRDAEEEGEDEEEEEGGHDTITSLAGERMLSLLLPSGARRSRAAASLSESSSGARTLEDLFAARGDEFASLEDIKESDDADSEGDEEKHSLLEVKSDEEEEEDAEEEEDEDEEDDVFVAPDGGYGWMVAVGAFISLFWSAGLVKSYGVIFDEIVTAFPGASKGLASWIPAVMVSMALAVAPVTSALCQNLDCRRVTFAGSALCAAGLGLSSLAPSLPFLFCSMGLLTGLGLGLSTTPGVILTARYFTNNRAKANSLCLSGTAAGSFCLPFLIEHLVAHYGLRGALLLLGACMGHISISAALYRPLRLHAAISRKRTGKEQQQQQKLEQQQQQEKLQQQEEQKQQDNSLANLSPLEANALNSPALSHSQMSVVSQKSGATSASADVYFPSNNLRRHSRHLHHRRHHNGGASGWSSPHHHQQQVPPLSLNTDCFFLPGGGPAPPASAPISSGECPFHGSSDLSLNGVATFGSTPPPPLPAALTELRYPYPNEDDVASDPHMVRVAARSGPHTPKALSLRDIALHQIGSKVNLYKSYLLGSNEKMGSRNSRRLSDVGSECSSMAASNVSFSSKAFHGEGGKGGGASARGKRRSSCRERSGTMPSGLLSRRSSLMFSLEGLCTDSTSILKDARASSSFRRSSTVRRRKRHGQHEQEERPTAAMSAAPPSRQVSMIADHAARAKAARAARKDRGRYFSEGHDILPTSPPLWRLDPGSSRGSKDLSSPVDELKAKPRTETPTTTTISTPDKSALRSFFAALDLSLCRDPVFLLLAASVMCMSLGVPHYLLFLPSHARAHSADPAVLLSVCSLLDLGGRLGAGIVLDASSDVIPAHFIYALSMLLSGTSALLLPLGSSSVFPMAVVSGLYGLSSGVWFLMVPLLLSEHLGVERIASSYGLVRFFQSGANLVRIIVLY